MPNRLTVARRCFDSCVYSLRLTGRTMIQSKRGNCDGTRIFGRKELHLQVAASAYHVFLVVCDRYQGYIIEALRIRNQIRQHIILLI